MVNIVEVCENKIHFIFVDFGDVNIFHDFLKVSNKKETYLSQQGSLKLAHNIIVDEIKRFENKTKLRSLFDKFHHHGNHVQHQTIPFSRIVCGKKMVGIEIPEDTLVPFYHFLLSDKEWQSFKCFNTGDWFSINSSLLNIL